MQNAAGGTGSAQSADRNDSYRAVVCELQSLLERVQAGMNLVQAAIAAESPLCHQELAANVVVLDDVTPRYQNARAALNACNTSLEVTFHLLRDTKRSQHRTNESAAYELRSARLVGRA